MNNLDQIQGKLGETISGPEMLVLFGRIMPEKTEDEISRMFPELLSLDDSHNFFLEKVAKRKKHKTFFLSVNSENGCTSWGTPIHIKENNGKLHYGYGITGIYNKITDPWPTEWPNSDIARDAIESIVNHSEESHVLFWANWCGHCDTIKSTLPELIIDKIHLNTRLISAPEEEGFSIQNQSVTSFPKLFTFHDGQFGGETCGPIEILRLFSPNISDKIRERTAILFGEKKKKKKKK